MPHLRHADLEEYRATRHSKAGAQSEEAAVGSRVETQIHQRQCLRCQRWFWAWGPDRRKCFVCDPPPREQLQQILGEIHGHDGRRNGSKLIEVTD